MRARSTLHASTRCSALGTAPPPMHRVAQELASTSHSGVVKEAMEAFVGRLMGSADPAVLRGMDAEFSTLELSKVLMWLMVVGWTLRGLEVGVL